MKLHLSLTIAALACVFSSCAPQAPVYIEDHTVTIQRPRYTEPKRTPIKRETPEEFRAVETAN